MQNTSLYLFADSQNPNTDFRLFSPPQYLLILPKCPLNPPRIPDNQASGPPFRRQQAYLACWPLSTGSNTSPSSLSRQLKKIEKNPLKRTNLALYGGEDFELVFTVHASKARTLKAIVPSVSYIGIINNCGKVRYFNNGKEEKSVYSGFRHF